MTLGSYHKIANGCILKSQSVFEMFKKEPQINKNLNYNFFSQLPFSGVNALPNVLLVKVLKEKMKVLGIVVFVLSKIIQKHSNVLCVMSEKEPLPGNPD